MSEPAFPLTVSAVLSRLTVPPLPDGFVDRLMARIADNESPNVARLTLPPLPQRRRGIVAGLGWRRSGRIIASVAALGLATATAAASGIFGDPIYVPVVSDALAKANLVELPAKPARAKSAKPLPTAASAKPSATEAPKHDGKDAVRNLINSKWQDPEFRNLPKAERQAAMRDAIRLGIENGEFTREDLLVATAEARAERKARNQEKTKQVPPKHQAIQQKVKAKIAQERARHEQASPAEKAEMREQRRVVVDKQKRMRELRRQLADAPPEAKPAIRKELRVLRQELAAAINSNTTIDEGNTDPVR